MRPVRAITDGLGFARPRERSSAANKFKFRRRAAPRQSQALTDEAILFLSTKLFSIFLLTFTADMVSIDQEGLL